MGKSQRRKGHQWERDVAKLFAKAMPGIESRRGLQGQGGEVVADVVNPLFHIECKCGKMPNPRAALKQAEADAKPGLIPIAVVKDDYQKPFVVLRLEDFLDDVVEPFWAETKPSPRPPQKIDYAWRCKYCGKNHFGTKLQATISWCTCASWKVRYADKDMN